MEETKVLLDTEEALKPILELAQESTNISTIRTVVLKALSDPKVFCGFDEIKQVVQPTVQSAGDEGQTILRTLDLFSYGTLKDYRSAVPGVYLTLTDTHLFKLQQLTLLTLVQQACSNLTTLTTTTNQNNNNNNNNNNNGNVGGILVPYQTVARELGFLADDTAATAATAAPFVLTDNVLRQVEELVLSCVYARVVSGSLCQKSAALVVTSRHGPPCRPRDVPISHGTLMLETLHHFHHYKVRQACRLQQNKQDTIQSELLAVHHHQEMVHERTKQAASSSSVHGGGGGGHHNPAIIGAAAAAAVRGWPADGGPDVERRLSDLGGGARGSSRRQTKRSRGGVAGVMDAFSRY